MKQKGRHNYDDNDVDDDDDTDDYDVFDSIDIVGGTWLRRSGSWSSGDNSCFQSLWCLHPAWWTSAPPEKQAHEEQGKCWLACLSYGASVQGSVWKMEDWEKAPKGSPEGQEGVPAKQGGEGEEEERQVWMVGKEGGQKEASVRGCSAPKEKVKAVA